MLTEASENPCDASVSSSEPYTIIPPKESFDVDAQSLAEASDTIWPIAEPFIEGVASWAAVKLKSVPTSKDEEELMTDLYVPDTLPDTSVDEGPSSSGNHSERIHGMPLPEFSYEVRQALEARAAYEVIHLVVEECANHILSSGDMTGKSAYSKFGKALIEKYPCLGSTLQHPPWRNFNKKLSQKLRQLRLLRNRAAPQGKSNTSLVTFGGSILNAEEASLQLRSEFLNVNRDWKKVVFVCNYLYGHRRSKIIQKDIPLSEILDLFPSLTDIKLIREEFKKIIAPTTIEDMKSSYQNMINILDVIFQSTEGDKDELTKLLKLQSELTDARINCRQKSGLTALLVQQAHDIETRTQKHDPPHLVVARHQDGSIQGWILAVGESVPCGNDGATVFDILIDMMACYYAWDVSYPKEFQFLAFIQRVVVGDKNTQYVSGKLNNFFRKFEHML